MGRLPETLTARETRFNGSILDAVGTTNFCLVSPRQSPSPGICATLSCRGVLSSRPVMRRLCVYFSATSSTPTFRIPHGRVEHKASLILDQLCIPSGKRRRHSPPTASFPPTPGHTVSARAAMGEVVKVGPRWVSRAGTAVHRDSLL